MGRITTARARLKGTSADVAGEKWSELTDQVEDAFGGIASAVKGFFSKS